MNYSRNFIYIIKNLFLFTPLGISLLFEKELNQYSFIIVSLLLIANAQIRNLLKKNAFVIVSLIIDLPIVIYSMNINNSYIYFILLATLIDIFLMMKSEITILSIYITVGYLYAILTSYHVEFSVIIIFLYIGFLFMLYQLRLELQSKKDMETLYDQIRKKNQELEIARSSLQSYSKQIEKITQLEERNRISRELHDTIGHSLTGILYQVDAAKKIIEHDQEKGLKLLDAVYLHISNSIESVRQTVRQLRPNTYQTYRSNLERLITEFRKNTNAQVAFKMIGTPADLYPSIEITIYRSIQEALTNAVRHGHAKHIDIKLLFHRNSIELIIEDDGIGSKDISYGFGLSGMKERLEVIGGSLTVKSENGFSIYINIPLSEG